MRLFLRCMLSLLLLLAVLALAGCTSHVNLTYDGLSFAVETITRGNNAGGIEALSLDPPESLRGPALDSPDGPYYVFEEVVHVGAVDELTIGQNGLNLKRIPYDGRRMIAKEEITLYTMDGETAGTLKAGESFIARQQAGSAVALFVGETTCYADARALELEDGEAVEYTPSQNEPTFEVKGEGVTTMTLGCQTSFMLSGERKISRIYLNASVTAVAEIGVDFDDLIIEGDTDVRILAGVTGGTVDARGEGVLIVEDGASVDVAMGEESGS